MRIAMDASIGDSKESMVPIAFDALTDMDVCQCDICKDIIDRYRDRETPSGGSPPRVRLSDSLLRFE